MSESKSGRFKQPIIDKLGSFFESKGFKEDKKSLIAGNAKNFCFVYSKGDPEPSLEEYLKNMENNNFTQLPREEIIISRSRWAPEFTVNLRSLLKEPACTNIGHLNNSEIQKWWSYDDDGQLEQACNEIKDLMNEYGWNWFQLP